MLFAALRGLLHPLFMPNCKRIVGAEHIPQDGPFLVAVNHVDYLDGFFVAAVLVNAGVKNMRVLTATSNYWWTGATIPIDPANKSAALEKAGRNLKGRTAVCIFVEGERNTSPVMLQGKTGIARLALASQLPVLPVGIIAQGSRSFWHSVVKQIRRENPYTVVIGAPLTFADLQHQPISHELLSSVTTRIQQAVAPLCNKTIDTHV